MKELHYVVTLQKSFNGELQEFLYLWPLTGHMASWDAGVKQYVEDHYQGRASQNVDPSWDGSLQQYTRTWRMATSWNLPTTLRLVARLWVVDVL